MSVLVYRSSGTSVFLFNKMIAFRFKKESFSAFEVEIDVYRVNSSYFRRSTISYVQVHRH